MLIVHYIFFSRSSVWAIIIIIIIIIYWLIYTDVQELKEVLRTVPEVQELVGKEESRKLLGVKEQDGGIGVRSYLKSAFTKLMTASDEAVSKAIANLKTRLNSESKVKIFFEQFLLHRYYVIWITCIIPEIGGSDFLAVALYFDPVYIFFTFLGDWKIFLAI